MTTWTSADLALLADRQSLVLAVADADHPGVEVGMVLVRGELYVRAHRGTASRWYRAARDHGHGRVRVGGATRHVRLDTSATEIAAAPTAAPATEIAAAFRDKYGEPAAALLTGPQARAATIPIEPAPRGRAAPAVAQGRGANRASACPAAGGTERVRARPAGRGPLVPPRPPTPAPQGGA
jgi:hypothetical protein